jgi:hypothetical protein
MIYLAAPVELTEGSIVMVGSNVRGVQEMSVRSPGPSKPASLTKSYALDGEHQHVTVTQSATCPPLLD